jgi:hypothetical protein
MSCQASDSASTVTPKTVNLKNLFWASDNPLTMRFPELFLTVYADHDQQHRLHGIGLARTISNAEKLYLLAGTNFEKVCLPAGTLSTEAWKQ